MLATAAVSALLLALRLSTGSPPLSEPTHFASFTVRIRGQAAITGISVNDRKLDFVVKDGVSKPGGRSTKVVKFRLPFPH